jgi:prepilin-type N-terminal cleavage/methylation domain-containing protein
MVLTKINKRSGFSLIELLVVVIMVGLVMAVSVGNIQKARERSDNTRLEAVTDLVRVGLEHYRGDFETYPDALIPPAGAASADGFLIDNTANPRVVRYVPGTTLPGNPWSRFAQANALDIGGVAVTTPQQALTGAAGVKACLGVEVAATGTSATTTTYEATNFGAILYDHENRLCFALYGVGRNGGVPTIVAAESNGRQR